METVTNGCNYNDNAVIKNIKKDRIRNERSTKLAMSK